MNVYEPMEGSICKRVLDISVLKPVQDLFVCLCILLNDYASLCDNKMNSSLDFH